jgi:hypothetical protein
MSTHGLQGPTGRRGCVRFQVIEVLDYFVVRDNYALPIRLHADGELYDRNTRLQPHSGHYGTRQEAVEVARWLTERAAGYPYNMLMAEWPPEQYTIDEPLPCGGSRITEYDGRRVIGVDIEHGPNCKCHEARSAFDVLVDMPPALKLGN